MNLCQLHLIIRAPIHFSMGCSPSLPSRALQPLFSLKHNPSAPSQLVEINTCGSALLNHNRLLNWGRNCCADKDVLVSSSGTLDNHLQVHIIKTTKRVPISRSCIRGHFHLTAKWGEKGTTTRSLKVILQVPPCFSNHPYFTRRNGSAVTARLLLLGIQIK